MGRGPAWLFGAIVAVGLGPALWLGVQVGAADAPEGKPPVVIRQQVPAAETDQGGSGAGEESDTPGPTAGWLLPLSTGTATVSAAPSVATSATSSPTPSPSSSPTPSAEPSEAPSEPPVESTPSKPAGEEESEPPPGEEPTSAPATGVTP
ncbi:hypothetical protein [Actinoplanes regularis]|uniref:Uncharacterized protein n=1 Tax=Actinoplanes regularis TaxID=52697 RepID=A0A239BFU6_9ACTN|nr:hypothetical protein [Actinoplanes regularis]GIE87957.1 hypothetical protein Are01nite_44370 [Actinoplanes regularis]SNS06361.1 hypothetical protein SAMN06264365_109161 [Actinoplanes regularis]